MWGTGLMVNLDWFKVFVTIANTYVYFHVFLTIASISEW